MPVHKLNKPELLAPAGNYEAMESAVQNGADAVYFGGKRFNARENTGNFHPDEVQRAITYCKLRGVKTYFTLNTLISDRNLMEVLDWVRQLYLWGVDAVIVQDIGLARILKKVLPNLELHGSTQMTVHNVPAAALLKSVGFSRIIAARELSIERLSELHRIAGIEIECFIHGALCFSYSGQCLFSSFLFKRSGNLGVCAQPCRLKYALIRKVNDGAWKPVPEQIGHLLSPKDLCAAPLISRLAHSGVTALKIEGRMRNADYVGAIVSCYRKLLDDAPVNLNDMTAVFNRGFTQGFLGSDLTNFINPRSSDNRGMLIGRVKSYNRKLQLAEISLEKPLIKGDGIRIDGARTGAASEVGCTVHSLWLDGRKADRAEAGERVSLKIPSALDPGDPVYKTFDKELTDRTRATYRQGKELRKVPITVEATMHIGHPLILSFSDRERSVTVVSEAVVERAIKRPITREILQSQCSRLGHTPFVLETFSCTLDEDAIIPLHEIGKLRKQLIDGLTQARTATNRTVDNILFKRELAEFDRSMAPSATGRKAGLAVHIANLEDLRIASTSACETIIAGNGFTQARSMDFREAYRIVKDAGKNFTIAAPAIMTGSEVTEEVNRILEIQPDAVLIGNLGMLASLVKAPDPCPALHLDYTFNIYNRSAASFYAELSPRIQRLCMSMELDAAQLKTVAGGCPCEVEIVGHGVLILMTGEYCLFRNNCKRQCLEEYALLDRLNLKLPIKGLPGCRMAILNPKQLALSKQVGRLRGIADVVRLDLRTTHGEDINRIIEQYHHAVLGQTSKSEPWSGADYTGGWISGSRRSRN